MKRAGRSLKGFLRIRAVTSVEGVRYRERSGVSLRRALGDTGSGVKEYRVRFLSGSERSLMKIRATRSRIYHDLMCDPRTLVYEQVIGQIRPGARVFELGCGTGAGSEMLSREVGPSGGVVSINRDGEAVRFARQRYPLENTGFELGWIETLAGEIDGAFDGFFAVNPMRAAADDPARSRAMGEIWRVVRPGGLLVFACSSAEHAEPAIGRMQAIGCERLRMLEPGACAGWVAAVGFKPGKESQDRGTKGGAGADDDGRSR